MIEAVRKEILQWSLDRLQGKASPVLVSLFRNILYTEFGRDGNSKSTIVHIECPNRPRKSIKVLAQILGCKLKQLRFDGLVIDEAIR